MKKIDFRKILQDRKTLILVLCVMIVSVFTLTIVYAALNAVLEINGNAEVVASNWDIHLENVEVKAGSVASNDPEISGTSSLSFDVDLSTPGDYYEFTVDVVNDGGIDAMIDSVVKTPELTTEQAKYINYIIEYENGESITTKQTLKSGTSTPIKVRVEYRSDISASDLPTSTTELSLKLILIYVQSDGTGSEIPNNGVKQLTSIVSGDLNTVGSEVTVADEPFYVLANDGTNVTLFAKYNLHVGNSSSIDESLENWTVTPLENPTGLQDSTALGILVDSEGMPANMPWIGTVAFSDTNYWSSTVSSYPADVYNSSASISTYVNNYKTYLETAGATVSEARLITYNELIGLGCSADDWSCSGAPSWVYTTTYWTGSARSSDYVWLVNSGADFGGSRYDYVYGLGVRPVVKISLSDF